MGMEMMIACMLFFEHINLQMQDIQTENQSSGHGIQFYQGFSSLAHRFQNTVCNTSSIISY
jgi:hypothetical protein